LGGFHIDDQLETSWLLDRQIGGLGAFEDFVDVHGSLAKKFDIYRRVGHQLTMLKNDRDGRRRGFRISLGGRAQDPRAAPKIFTPAMARASIVDL
jgi:hypothetical protein